MENKRLGNQFSLRSPSRVPYRTERTPPACANRAAYPDPPPVILLPESIAAQAAYQLRYKNTEYYSWVSFRPEMFQVPGPGRGIGALRLSRSERQVTVFDLLRLSRPGLGHGPSFVYANAPFCTGDSRAVGAFAAPDCSSARLAVREHGNRDCQTYHCDGADVRNIR